MSFLLLLCVQVLSNFPVTLSYNSPFVVLKDISDYNCPDTNTKSKNANNNPIDSSDSTIVYTEYGYIEGIRTATARVFRKIPYGAPPVNKTGRWQSPREPESWGPDTVLQAKGDPPACPQPYCGQWEACGRKQTQVYSEDCLYLNVYTPLNGSNSSDTSLLPVMFFIHGGMYQDGYGGGYLYNGTDMTNLTNVITVAINYRLGILGYYWNDKYGFQGNYGIEDQILALKWVQNNIKYFGGDPNKVAVFGQSAGAMSIASLMMIDEAKELFSGCIWESEPLGIPFRNSHTWGEIPQLFIDKAQCNNNNKNSNKSKDEIIDCMYDLDPNEIINLQSEIDASVIQLQTFIDAFVPWTPTVGTGFLSTQPFWYFQNGTKESNSKINNKALMAGTVENEGDLFIYTAFSNGIDYATMMILLKVVLKTDENIEKILEQYPLPPRDNTTDYRRYASDITTDGLFHCPNRNVTATLSSATNDKDENKNIFLFHFNHVPSFADILWDPINATECLTRVCHGSDLPFVFRPNGGPVNVSFPENEMDLAKAMQFYWAQFGKSQTPGDGNTKLYNNGTIVNWGQFNVTMQNTMIFDVDKMKLVSNYDKDKCQVWDEINYPWLPHP